ncbi:hypothetical protein Acor_57510 [Acrocarpospora corrugata]|uniref:Uncharacterized protein n=1 Tax=Acrocarpospora corrugata TaxID=35763 RepID=A0A5M3W3S0_9ACTN|nr:hypothetical protein [Acrocarpospora corrugata]GES03685.1 hypothetical protein Acor_57510 [Acrocarpospora corrugata]
MPPEIESIRVTPIPMIIDPATGLTITVEVATRHAHAITGRLATGAELSFERGPGGEDARSWQARHTFPPSTPPGVQTLTITVGELQDTVDFTLHAPGARAETRLSLAVSPDSGEVGSPVRLSGRLEIRTEHGWTGYPGETVDLFLRFEETGTLLGVAAARTDGVGQFHADTQAMETGHYFAETFPDNRGHAATSQAIEFLVNWRHAKRFETQIPAYDIQDSVAASGNVRHTGVLKRLVTHTRDTPEPGLPRYEPYPDGQLEAYHRTAGPTKSWKKATGRATTNGRGEINFTTKATQPNMPSGRQHKAEWRVYFVGSDQYCPCFSATRSIKVT